MAISYTPLMRQLAEKRLKKQVLLHNGISAMTIAKFGKDEPVSLPVIDRVCQILKCPIEDVVEITLDETETDAHE